MQRTVTLAAPAVCSALLALAFSAPLCAQDVWSPRPGVGPSARDRHAIAYDSQRGQVVLFGGHDGASPLGDTWTWDGGFWSQIATTTIGPAPRSGHGMVHDGQRGRVVLFGGHDGASALGDTWEWDGSAWSLAATTGPAPRSGHAIAHDGQRGRVVLFGGHDGASALGDTWEWDGSAWTAVATGGPAPRSAHGMAYDARRTSVVLFGGEDAATRFGDTWVWAASAWTQVATTGPAARRGHGMVFDDHRERVVLFGGDSGFTTFSPDTWLWDGGAWMQASVTGPVARAGHAMAYDLPRRRVTLLGGSDGAVRGDTWTLACTPWCDLGQDTPGSHGRPRLVGQGPLEPGTAMTLTLSNALAGSTAALVIGVASKNLPFAGGTIVPDPALIVPMPTLGTPGAPATVTSNFNIPLQSPSGVTLYFQHWILDAAGPFGFAVSNAIVGTTRRTLFDEISSSLDAMLGRAAPPAASSLAIYSVQDFTNLVFVRNPACWAALIDLTGLSPWNQAYTNKRAGTLVSPRHIVFAQHYPLSTSAGSNDIAFVTQQGVTVIRKLVSVTYPAVDIGVGLLDADVPPEIKFYKVLPQTFTQHLRATNGLPMLHLDQEEKALVRDMNTTTPGASYSYHRAPVDPTRALFSETLIGGDSGNPAFLLVDGEAILILTHHYATGGPFYTFHASAVNAAMSQLGGGYQLTEVDLALVPR